MGAFCRLDAAKKTLVEREIETYEEKVQPEAVGTMDRSKGLQHRTKQSMHEAVVAWLRVFSEAERTAAFALFWDD